jgi:hypothetical protein
MGVVKVTLKRGEILQAALVGCMRQTNSLLAGHRDQHGADQKNGWQYHIDGALGEYAVARHLGVFWWGDINRFDGADVGRHQVRCRSVYPGVESDLIVRQADKDEDNYILVLNRCPTFDIVGWITGGDAKREEFWSDPSGRGVPAWFVPQCALRPIDQIPVI